MTSMKSKHTSLRSDVFHLPTLVFASVLMTAGVVLADEKKHPANGDKPTAAIDDTKPADKDGWKPLFNQRDLTGWDKWLGPTNSGYLDPKTTKEPPLGLNHDPLGA